MVVGMVAALCFVDYNEATERRQAPEGDDRGTPMSRLNWTLLVTAIMWAVPKAATARDPDQATAPNSVQVKNEQGKVTTLSAADLGKLPRVKVTATGHSGKAATYEGVSLAEVLRAANVTLGQDLKGPLLANWLVVVGADGYRVVFSLPEVDPALTDKSVLLADTKDGKPLDDKEGPYRLIVPHDKRAVRWVRQVTQVIVQRGSGVQD
jgi:hypothetical protein